MARIPDEELGRIKREVSLRALVEAAGVGLSRHGANGDLAGRCVFHPDDETPSMVVTESKGLFHCFGCGAGGDAIAWVERIEGVSFRHAVELLREGYAGRRVAEPVKQSTVVKLPCPLSEEADGARLLGEVADFYHASLLESPEALGYLEKRGLRDEELIARFRLGYANRTLGYRLPASNRVAGERLRGRLQEVGVFRSSGHELMSGSLVVPIFSAAGEVVGQVVGMYGRKTGERLREGTPLHLYLPGPHRGIWNREALRDYEEVIVCEALLDAMTFWRWGYRNVTAVYGVEGLTDELCEALVRSTKRVLFAYDRDAAGDRAAIKHAAVFFAHGIECFRIEFPRGMDANEYAQKVQPAGKSLGALIRGAEWMGTGARPAVTIASEPRSLAAEPPASEPVATPMPAAPPDDDVVTVEGEAVVVERGDRRYRVRGLDRTADCTRMKVNVAAMRGEAVHSDVVDLARAAARAGFAKEAAVELGIEEGIVRQDLGRVLSKLEQLRDERLRAAEAPNTSTVALTDEEREAALELLRDPRVLDRILEDFARCGVVGEQTNKLVGILAAISRKLSKPLGVLIQSSSAAGKTSLMEAILAFVPPEERVKYSAMTGQSLFYMSEQDLRHKVLALVEEEGAERASYALKLLQSEGELAIASTGKDPQSGRLVTHEYRVEGPVALLLTTTAAELDEELLNRCIVLTVDEDREQTRAIHRQQREHYTLEGLWAREDREELRRLHQNAQRLLRPLGVVIPWARRMTFLDDKTRTRRDHEKYLTLIAVIALVHQYQREIRTDEKGARVKHYIEATLSDIETANRLASEVLGRSLDELAPQTRRLLELIERMVTDSCARLRTTREQYRFTQRQAREATGWGATQVKVHLQRLVDLEYVLVHRGGRGQQFVYELVYDGAGKDGRPFLVGLIDVAALAGHEYDAERSGENVEWSGGGRGEVGGRSPGGRGGPMHEIATPDGANAPSEGNAAKNAYMGEVASSYEPRRHSRGGGR